MARAARDNRLDTRTQRLKLEPEKRYFLNIGEGVSLCYRRGKTGAGVWFCRTLDAEGKQRIEKVGEADDFQDHEENPSVLNFNQAQELCRKIIADVRLPEHKRPSKLTVAEAVDHYLKWFEVHRKSLRDTQRTIEAHILPVFGKQLVSDLTSIDIKRWHQNLATRPPRIRSSKSSIDAKHPAGWIADEDTKRSRKSTANRILTVLKAILNKAFEDKLVNEDTEWRRVKPFKDVDRPIERFLTEEECNRLLASCELDFRNLVFAALLTGCRYGELIALIVSDFDARASGIWIRESKSGKPRFVTLNQAGQQFFNAVVLGKKRSGLILTRANGEAWGRSHQVRRMKESCAAAGIDPPASFHELRHSYASHLIQKGVHLKAIATLLGHADTRITERHYSHLDSQTLRDAVNQLPTFNIDSVDGS